MKTAIIIPAFNEAETIAAVVRGVAPYGQPVVVDDGSRDDTAARAEAAGALVVRRGSNRGYDAALESGFELAERLGVEVAVTFDADGQHDAAILARVIEPLEKASAAMVLGIRPRAARFSEALFNVYTRRRFGVADIMCGLKAFRMDMYREHGRVDGGRSIGTELALSGLRRGVPYATVPVPIHDRRGEARFGSAMTANLRILWAMALGIWTDAKHSIMG